jgi:hypothetical protein
VRNLCLLVFWRSVWRFNVAGIGRAKNSNQQRSKNLCPKTLGSNRRIINLWFMYTNLYLNFFCELELTNELIDILWQSARKLFVVQAPVWLENN